MILISAPAGAGKTVLLSSVLRSLEVGHSRGAVSAWLDVRDRDNNASVLCADINDVLARALRDVAGTAPRVSPRGGARHLSVDLAAAIEGLGRPMMLILDDAHVLHDPAAIAVLEFLLEHAPSNLTIAVAARYDPPLAWHRLALDRRLLRIDTADLALEEAEIVQSLAAHDVRLAPEELALLAEATQGWCALVQLAALLLAGARDHRQTLADLARTPRPMADYLVGEVLAAIPDATVRFMLHTSIVDTFTADLADKLSGACAERELDTLSRLNIPITREARADGLIWHSYHPLLRAHLRAEFRRRLPGLQDHARTVAADWLLAHRHPLAAFEHELRLADEGRITAIIRSAGLGIVLDGRGAILTAECTRIPPAIAATAPVRLLRVALALALQDIASATTHLDVVAECGFAGDDWARALWTALRLDAALATPSDDRASLADELRSLMPTGDDDLAAYAHLQLGTAALSAGAFEPAVESLLRAIAFGQVNHRHRIVLRSLSRIATANTFSGDIALASAQVDAALDYSRAHGIDHLLEAEQCLALRTIIGYVRDEPCATGMPGPANLTRPQILGSTTRVTGGLAAVVFAVHEHEYGDTQHKHDSAAKVRSTTGTLIESPDFPFAPLAFLPMVVQICLRVGQPQWASQLVDDADGHWEDAPELRLCRASIEFAAGKVANARAALDAAECRPQDALLVNGVYAPLLGACIESSNGRDLHALEQLRVALRVAEPTLALRPFLDMRVPVWELLTRFSGLFREQEQFAAVVRARLTPARSTVVPPLTPSERDVLEQIATGDSAKGIAAGMCLSINTIKTHLSSIYRKLGVRNRHEAVVRARELGLI